MLGAANSALQIGSLVSTLVCGAIVQAHGLRYAFTVAAVVFAVAATPIALELLACARGRARRGKAPPTARLFTATSSTASPAAAVELGPAAGS